MTTMINKIRTSLKNRREINRAVRELNSLSDRNIRDMGLNPYLVRQGAKAFPWK